MKLTIRSENGEKVVDLKNNLQFNTIKGEQYIFSNGFTNYVLNFKDNQESVVLTFNVDGKSIKVELNGIVPFLQANTPDMSNPTAIIINKDINDKDVDSIVKNDSFNGGEIIDRLEAIVSKPVELGNDKGSSLSLIKDYQSLLESLGAAAAGGEAVGRQPAGGITSNGSTFNSIFSLNADSLNSIADTDRWENISESISSIPVDTADTIGSTTIIDTVTLTLDDVNVNEGVGTATVGGKLDYAPQTPLVVTLSNGSTITFGPDYVVGTTVQSTPFAVQGDDVYKDGQTYEITVANTTGGNFENLVTTDKAVVTVTDTIDITVFKLFKSDSSGNIITADSKIYEDGETSTYYVVKAVDALGNVLAVQPTGTVGVTFTNNGTTTVADYTPSTITATIGTAFSAKAVDDALVDNGETFTVSLNANSYSNASIYEKVEYATDTVTTTIVDNEFSLKVIEDVPYTLTKNDFGIDTSSVSVIKISSLPTNGTLTLNGTVVLVDTIINVNDIISNKLVFTPNLNTDNDSNFTFETSNDGTIWNTTLYTTSVNVIAVADAPIVSINVKSSVTIDDTNVTDTTGGYVVNALYVKGDYSSNVAISTISNTDHDGFGVSGDSSGDYAEIGYNNTTKQSEELIVSFGEYNSNGDFVYQTVANAAVSFAWKHQVSWGETAVVEFYRNGMKISVQTYYGGSDGVDAPINMRVLDATGALLAFDQIRFSALGYGDDYLIHSITYQEAEADTSGKVTNYLYDVDLSASLTDTDGSEALTVQISGVPSGATFTATNIVDLGNGIWQLSVPSGSTSVNTSFEMKVPSTTNQDFSLKVVATSTETNDSSTATSDILFINDNDTIDLTSFSTNNSYKNVTDVVDMTNTKANIMNLNMSDVVDLVDSDKQLIIKGDLEDKVQLDTPTDWANAGQESLNGTNYNVYKGIGVNSTIKLLIEEEIDII